MRYKPEFVELIVWLDDQFFAYPDVRISPLAHSIAYATSVYEGLRCYKGKIFKFQEHDARLRQSSKIFHHGPIPGAAVLEQVCYQLLDLNRLQDAYIRIQAFYDDADLSPSGNDCGSHFLVAAVPFALSGKQKGLALSIADWRRPPASCHSYAAKASPGYALSFLSLRSRADWADDVLFMSMEDEVCEASGSNIFFLGGQTLVTPPTDRCLDGITRRTIIESIAPSLGLAVDIRRIPHSDLGLFDGCFLCGTAVEIKEVSRIGEVTYGKQKWIEHISENYQKEIHA